MSYTIRRSNGTTLVTVADQTTDTSATALSLVGRGASTYGVAFAENFVYLLENFANGTAPSRPLSGQLWYDSTNNLMKYYDGATWRGLSSGGGTGDTTLIPGGGTTIGGDAQGSIRVAGATGVIVTWGGSSTTIGVTLSEGKIISTMSCEAIPNAELPATVRVGDNDLTLKSRFPNGIFPGITLATDSKSYVFAGTATSSFYADIAERYETSEALEPGDVVELGGSAEIQKTTSEKSDVVFGVISTNPAYRMNEGAGNDDSHPFVALAGRVPCKVLGPVSKGQRLVSSATAGVAMAWDGSGSTLAIVGRALADKTTSEIGLVEIVVSGVK